MKPQSFLQTILGTNLVIALLAGCGAPVTQVFIRMPPIQTERIATPTSDNWTDDFNGVLAAGWSWVNEDSTHWSLEDTPGALRILTQGHSLSSADKPKNLFVRAAPAGDFEIMTKLTFDPHDNFQQAAILIFQDEANVVLLKRGFCGVRGCPGRGIFLDNVVEGNLEHANAPRKDSSLQTAWLRLRKEGVRYIGFYSADGQTWQELGQVQNPLAPASVGLTANNLSTDPYAPQIPADFDSFTVQGITLGQ